MAKDEDYINKTDLENVIQRVKVENETQNINIANPDAISDPLMEESKKNELKVLEEKIERKKQSNLLIDALKGMTKVLFNGFKGFAKGIVKAPIGILKMIIGAFLTFATAVAVFTAVISPIDIFLRRLKKVGGFLTNRKTAFLKGFGKKIDGFFDALRRLGRNIKAFGLKKVRLLPKPVQKFLFKLFDMFSKLVNVAKKFNRFKRLFNVVRIMGRVFLPITILFAIFDFVKGFMKGYKEGGIIKGITEGIVAVFDGLVGGLLRLLAWIPKKIFELLGLENLAAAVMPALEGVLDAVKNSFRGLVNVVVGIFTLDGERIKKGFGQYLDAMISSMTMPFKLLNAFVQDIFGINDPFAIVKEAIVGMWTKITETFQMLKEALPKIIKEAAANVPGAKVITKGLKKLGFFDDEPSRVVKRAPRQLGTNYMSLGGMRPPQRSQPISANTQTNNNVSNSVSYNIQGNTNLASDALNFATGSSTGFYAPAR